MAATSIAKSDIDLFSDEVLSDPYPVLAHLRSLGGVVHLPAHDAYVLTRYHACRDALREWQTFESGHGVMMNQPTNDMVGGRIMLCTDGDHHTRLRRVVAAPLAPRALEEVRAHIKAEAEVLVERLVAERTFDVTGDLSQHIPVKIVTSLVGFPEAGRERMVDWGTASFNAIGPLNERALGALTLIGEMNQFMDNECVPGKLSPDGWAQQVWDAVGSGQLEAHEPPALMTDYMGPALDTTINATANLMWLFATNPDQWELLSRRPELTINAINESLRMEATIQCFSRLTSTDYEIDGAILPAGSRVIVHYGSANHDEQVFPDADRFLIDRPNADQHLATGFGRHACPGGHLARLEMSSILDELRARVSRIELVEARRMIHNIIRGFETLVVTVSGR